MYSVNPFGNSTLSCNVGSTALSPECPWIAEGTGIDWKSLDSSNIEILSSLLLLVPGSISNLQVAIAKHRRTSSCARQWCHCSGSLRRFLEGVKDHVVSARWWLLTLHNTYDRVIVCFNIDPFPFKNKNRNGRQRCFGLLSWSCFSNGFHWSCVLFFRGQHRFRYVLVNVIHESDTRNGIVLKQTWYLNFDTVSSTSW